MEKKKTAQIRPVVLAVPLVIFGICIVLGFVNNDAFIGALNVGFEALMWNGGWFLSLVMLLFIGFLLLVLFGPLGKIRIGGPNARPKMTYWQWFVIALCAGIGTGVVFWGAVEPIRFAFETAPSLGLEPGSNDAVRWGMRTTFLHWTFTPYAIYVAFGVVLSYVCYNMKTSYNASAGLVPVFGKKIMDSKWATVIDTLCIFALIGGTSGSMGFGIMQLTKGTEMVFGVPYSIPLFIGIAVLIFVLYMLTSVSGLGKGIQWLGDKNAIFYIILLGFMLFAGPTAYILNLFVQSTGDYFQNFIGAMCFTSPFPDSQLWPQWWDQYWWCDWLSYGPLMGLFFVRLSYGRTLKEFVVVNWIAPSVFGMIWFSIFGGLALHEQFYGGMDLYNIYQTMGSEAMTFAVLEALPFGKALQAFMIVIVIASFATLANSMISTIASSTCKESDANEEAPSWVKWIWGIIIILTSIVFTLFAGIDGIKMVKTYAGFPIAIVGVLYVGGFLLYMGKRPRDGFGNYEYEAEVANDPDNGAPMMELGWLDKKIVGIFKKS